MRNNRILTGTDHIHALFAATEADGTLTLQTESGADTVVRMDWKQEDAERIIAKLETLLTALTRLGETHEVWVQALQDMPEDLRLVYDTYLAPYPEHGLDQEALFHIFIKEEYEEPLTADEEQLLEAQRNWMCTHALTRLPQNRCNPAALIQRARRYERLVALGAPKAVVDNEICCLARELVLYEAMDPDKEG